MLRRSKELKGYKLGASDGELGHVKDFYFDDHAWVVRYLVADTGTWLAHRKVLISPLSITGIDSTPHKLVHLKLTRKQVEDSPPIEQHKPVSRQYEAQYFQYYGWPYYWPGPLLWGPLAFPGPFVSTPGTMAVPQTPPQPPPEPEDAHLRSMDEVSGYSIQALDADFGHVDQFIVDEKSWAIRYLVIHTGNWFPGKTVLLAQQWISSVSWREARVYLDLDRESVKRAPEYRPGVEITRAYEQQLFEHYARTPYWESENVRA